MAKLRLNDQAVELGVDVRVDYGRGKCGLSDKHGAEPQDK
jgi:hypothetical protein